LDPRRPRRRGHLQPRPRLRLRRVGRPRDRDLVRVVGADLILASASPRRRELLAALGVEFEVVVPDVEEITEGASPADVVLENARRKARAAATSAGEGSLVLAVDTDVAIDGRLLGKAGDERGARERLEALSGRTHEVLSG